MERILLVGSTDTLRENISFVLQLAGFEVSFVKSLEEAINLNDLHRCFTSTFDMLVILGAELLNVTRNSHGLLKKTLCQVKILIAERQDDLSPHQGCFDNLYGAEDIYFCDTTNITVAAKMIFGRN